MRSTTLAGPALAICLLLLGGVPTAGATHAPTMKFGIAHDDLGTLSGWGAKPDYAQLWAGVWNERSGWSHFTWAADSAADRGVMPLVEWWYWGDDISKGCVESGCWSGLHDAWKSRTKWREDAIKLADALHAGLKGRRGVLVIETEFNKGGVESWETFDGYLAEHARIFRDRAPELQLVLGFGNWGATNWDTFDRAVGAVDMTGLQALRGSTRDSASSYLGVVDALEAGAGKLRSTFGKPVLLHDIALSSYWEPTWSGYQERVVKDLMARLGELKAAGVRGIVYRTLDDNPRADLANYYGKAERSWGLRRSDGSWKPALNDWIAGVKEERADPAPFAGSDPLMEASVGFQASFTPRSQGNNWWVEVKVSSAEAVAGVDARVNGGSWTALPKTSWGTWAKSLYAPNGANVEFRARDTSWTYAYSDDYTWW